MNLAELLVTQEILDDGDLARLVDGLASGVVALRSNGATFPHVRPGDVYQESSGRFVVVSPDPVAGSPDEFTAPESSRHAPADRARSDVYSASALVARAAFGPKWQQASQGSDPLAFELGRGLEQDPSERHSSMSAWSAAVAQALAERQEIIAAAAPREPSRASTIGGTIVAILVIAALLAALVPLGSGDAPVDEPPPAEVQPPDAPALEA